ncbi:MAG TPA: hypothetical protein VK110_04320 [Salinisphaeraceae bacterium]|nr:hypothetical protein [Salinisphaeraceae bacterium]
MRIESVIWDEWYPVAIADDLQPGRTCKTQLLGHGIEYGCDSEGKLTAWHAGKPEQQCRTQTRYLTHWVSLGDPQEPFFEVPEDAEPDRRIVGSGSMSVHVSGLRAIENFLDMAHFPFVHDGYLGAEPYTDVEPYTVTTEANGDLYARDCRFFQPRGAASAEDGGGDMEYVYRVVRPFVAFLYKTNPVYPDRMDAIGLFVQPVSEEHCIAHTVLFYLDNDTEDHGLRLFQQTIFGQDLMILSNEIPRTLPLNPGFEMPVRADAMSMAYRRWLSDRGVNYGTYRDQGSQPLPSARSMSRPAASQGGA